MFVCPLLSCVMWSKHLADVFLDRRAVDNVIGIVDKRELPSCKRGAQGQNSVGDKGVSISACGLAEHSCDRALVELGCRRQLLVPKMEIAGINRPRAFALGSAADMQAYAAGERILAVGGSDRLRNSGRAGDGGVIEVDQQRIYPAVNEGHL